VDNNQEIVSSDVMMEYFYKCRMQNWALRGAFNNEEETKKETEENQPGM